MKLWRISDFANLSGQGGLLYSARGHSAGRPIVYCADHPAGALAEHLVHINWNLLPDRFQLLTLEVDDNINPEQLDAESLAPGWRGNLAVTRAAGDGWLATNSSLLLRVPSVILPDVYNVLINPLHPDMLKIRIAKTESVPLDGRLGPSRS